MSHLSESLEARRICESDGEWPVDTGITAGITGKTNQKTNKITRLDIVHIKRSIGIRSKIHKPVSEVLQPIMARYLPDTPMDQVTVRLAGTKLPVNMVDPVSTLKEQRVVLELKEMEFRKVKHVAFQVSNTEVFISLSRRYFLSNFLIIFSTFSSIVFVFFSGMFLLRKKIEIFILDGIMSS